EGERRTRREDAGSVAPCGSARSSGWRSSCVHHKRAVVRLGPRRLDAVQFRSQRPTGTSSSSRAETRTATSWSVPRVPSADGAWRLNANGSFHEPPFSELSGRAQVSEIFLPVQLARFGLGQTDEL